MSEFNPIASPMRVAKQYVNVSKQEEKSLMDIFGENNAARGRVLGNALEALPNLRANVVMPVVAAFTQSFEAMKNSITDSIQVLLQRSSRRDAMLDVVEAVFCAGKLFGGELYAGTAEHATLFELGLVDCRMTFGAESCDTTATTFGYYKIREAFVLEAVEEVLSTYRPSSAALAGAKKCLGLMRRNYNPVDGKGAMATGKGDDAETMEGYMLYFLSEEAQRRAQRARNVPARGKTTGGPTCVCPQGAVKLGTILCTSLGTYILSNVSAKTKKQLLGSWLNKTQFNVSALKRFTGENERVYLGSPESTGHLLQPSMQHRADFIMRMDLAGEYMLACGSKLYSSALSVAQRTSQERSTDISWAYSKADEAAFTAAMVPYSQEWKTRVADRVKGVLRIHFLLPHCAAPAPELCIVTKIGHRVDVTINIDQTVFKEVFANHRDRVARDVFVQVGKVLANLSRQDCSNWI